MTESRLSSRDEEEDIVEQKSPKIVKHRDLPSQGDAQHVYQCQDGHKMTRYNL